MEQEAVDLMTQAVLVGLCVGIVAVMAMRGAFGREAFVGAPVRKGHLQGAGALVAVGLWVIGPGFAMGLAMALGLMGEEGGGTGGGEGAMEMNIICTQLGAIPMVVFILWYASFECENGLRGFGLGGDRLMRGVGWGLVGGLVVFLVSQGLSVVVMAGGEILGLEAPQIAHDALKELAEEPGGRAAMVLMLSAVVGAPFLEELLFRGMLQTALIQSPMLGTWCRGAGRLGCGGEVGLNRWHAIVICSLLFALIHLPIASPLALPSYYVLGLGFGYVYERTGSLWAPMVMHGVFNGINIYLVTSGMVSEG